MAEAQLDIAAEQLDSGDGVSSATDGGAEAATNAENRTTATKEAAVAGDGTENAAEANDGTGTEEGAAETGKRKDPEKVIDLSGIDLTAIGEDEVIPDKGTAHSLGRKVNVILCVIAFVVLFGYLFIAGEGEQTLNALRSFNYAFLLLALIGIVVYWLLEALSMQIICDSLFKGFSFVKTVIVTIIGQYFNCITPLSSGGQPMQAYYYSRFGLPVEHAMPMLLCRFIVYQLTMTVYAVIVLILRFNYFTQDLRPIMYLVAIGFLGGFVLISMLFALAFAKNSIIKAASWGIKLAGRIGILKHPETTLENALNALEESYTGMRFLLKDPHTLVKVSLVTFVQLTVYFSLSWVIFAGFGLESNDYVTVVSCQAFVYLISSFIPLPGAVGVAESSYITFFNYVYGNPSIVALSTFIWRFFTFYLPIILGMTLTLMVNNENSWLAKWIAEDDARMAREDHTVEPRESKKGKKKAAAKDASEGEGAGKTEGSGEPGADGANASGVEGEGANGSEGASPAKAERVGEAENADSATDASEATGGFAREAGSECADGDERSDHPEKRVESADTPANGGPAGTQDEMAPANASNTSAMTREAEATVAG